MAFYRRRSYGGFRRRSYGGFRSRRPYTGLRTRRRAYTPRRRMFVTRRVRFGGRRW